MTQPGIEPRSPEPLANVIQGKIEMKNGFGLVSLFNDISTFVGYLMPKPFFSKNTSGTI